MKTFRLMLGAAVAVTGLAIATAADAAPSGIRVGDLTCNVASGWGFVFGSSKDLHCTYRGSNGHREHYTGAISKFGVDLGYTDGVVGVFVPTSDMAKGALSGDHVGATPRPPSQFAGANVLIGGFKVHRPAAAQRGRQQGRMSRPVSVRSACTKRINILDAVPGLAPRPGWKQPGPFHFTDRRPHLGMMEQIYL